jgi:hypothetical protein
MPCIFYLYLLVPPPLIEVHIGGEEGRKLGMDLSFSLMPLDGSFAKLALSLIEKDSMSLISFLSFSINIYL